MPEISRFFGIVISMDFEDHAPPHFHARYGEYKARIAIESADVLAGSLPPRVLGLVVERATIHRSELHRDWKRVVNRQALDAIEPLR